MSAHPEPAGLRVRDLVARPGGARVLRGVDLDVSPGARAALVGPSGAGKTTLLRAIAGLQQVEAGTIDLGGRELLALPPHRRPIAMVFQEPRLLPHLDALDNVAFPLRAAGTPRRERREQAAAMLDAVGLAGAASRAPRSLSGGEQQRVALARALCARPSLLLLDEPLASVDPDRRDSLRALIVRIQRELGVTMLIVTHDQREAAALGERAALMIEGRIVQTDVPEALVHRPSSPLVARFFGNRNLIAGVARAGVVETPAGPVAVDAPDGPLELTVRPERMRVGTGPLRMQVRSREPLGVDVRLRLGAGSLTLEADVDPADAPAVGEVVAAEAPATAAWVFPAASDRAAAEDALPR